MRWLLVKDLQILRRSPLLVALLVLYPAIVALLIGFALSRGPSTPRVAFLSQIPPDQSTLQIGAERIDLSRFAERYLHSVRVLHVHSLADARSAVRSGDAVAAIVLPADLPGRLETGVEQAHVDVLLNGDALNQQYVRSTLQARLAQANQAFSAQLEQVAVQDLGLLVSGGQLQTPLGAFDLLGLQATQRLLDRSLATLPPHAPQRGDLTRIRRFAELALEGLGLARGGLAAVSQPVQLRETFIAGTRTPLDAYAVAIAVSMSLMLVCVLLAAGMLALEREEQAFGRLVRGLVGRSALLAEKVLLAAGCAFVVALALLCGIGGFASVDWSRFGLWVVALALGALGFGALGVAVGAVAREVRAASLLGVLLALPVAFLALVPNGAVGSGLYGAIRAISAIFPFKPALDATNVAVNGGGGLAGALLHLVGLTVLFGVLARLALRRFA